MIYLDYAATTPVLPEAREAMLRFLTDEFGNPGSVHPPGMAARVAVEEARKRVAALIGAEASEIVFTSGATEANNLAIRGILTPPIRLLHQEGGPKRHAVTTNIEHPSVSETFAALTKQGVEVTVVPTGKDGVVKAEDVLAAVRPETVLVSVMWVNNEIGTIQPIEEIAQKLGPGLRRAELDRSRGDGPLLHVDAVQAAVSMAISVRPSTALGVDLLSLSAHKLGGPKGVGALYIRKGVKLAPVLTGGGQEFGLRSGTENVAGIAGFGAAVETSGVLNSHGREHLERLGEALDRELAGVGGIARRLLSKGVPTAPHIVALEVPGADADYMVLLLGKKGVAVSAGSACHAGSRETSKILNAIGLPDQRARSVIRLSFGPGTSEDDIRAFAQALKDVVKMARG